MSGEFDPPPPPAAAPMSQPAAPAKRKPLSRRARIGLIIAGVAIGSVLVLFGPQWLRHGPFI